MNVAIVTLLGLALSPAIAGQSAERQKGAFTMADYDYGARLDGCSVAGAGDAATVSGRLFVRFQPDQRLPAGDGIAVDVVLSDSGAPTVSAHAINTKGTGSNNGRAAASACAVDAATGAPRRGVVTAATCAIEEGPDGATVTFSVPLGSFGSSQKNYVGHVTLIKRGDDAGGARIVAACNPAKPMRAGYDLATSKK